MISDVVEKIEARWYKNGKSEGNKEAEYRIALEMLRCKVKDDDIIQFTNILKQDLEKLKEEENKKDFERIINQSKS